MTAPVSLHRWPTPYHLLPEVLGLKPNALASTSLALGVCTLGISGSKAHFFSVCLERFLALLTSFERRLRSGCWRDDRRWPRGPSAAATRRKCTASVARAAFQSEDEKWLLKLGRKWQEKCALSSPAVAIFSNFIEVASKERKTPWQQISTQCWCEHES